MRRTKVQKMMIVAVLAAMAYVLMFIKIPLIPAFPFLTADFSDIPVFIAMFLFGPGVGAATAAFRCILNFLLTGGGNLISFVGSLASFMATICFTFPIYFFFRKDITHLRQALVRKLSGVVMGIASLTGFMCLANYFILLPLYMQVGGLPANSSIPYIVLAGILPFNILKGILVSVVFGVIYIRLLPWLSKQISYSGEHNKRA